jgi:hypothetical protein
MNWYVPREAPVRMMTFPFDWLILIEMEVCVRLVVQMVRGQSVQYYLKRGASY